MYEDNYCSIFLKQHIFLFNYNMNYFILLKAIVLEKHKMFLFLIIEIIMYFENQI